MIRLYITYYILLLLITLDMSAHIIITIINFLSLAFRLSYVMAELMTPFCWLDVGSCARFIALAFSWLSLAICLLFDAVRGRLSIYGLWWVSVSANVVLIVNIRQFLFVFFFCKFQRRLHCWVWNWLFFYFISKFQSPWLYPPWHWFWLSF